MSASVGLLAGAIVFSLSMFAREGGTRATIAVAVAWLIGMCVGVAMMYAGFTRVAL